MVGTNSVDLLSVVLESWIERPREKHTGKRAVGQAGNRERPIARPPEFRLPDCPFARPDCPMPMPEANDADQPMMEAPQ